MPGTYDIGNDRNSLCRSGVTEVIKQGYAIGFGPYADLAGSGNMAIVYLNVWFAVQQDQYAISFEFNP